MLTIAKPEAGNYAPYAKMYLDLVPDDGNVLDFLNTQMTAMPTFVASLPVDQLQTPFAEGEWTIKEILVHITDTERIYSYRALRFSRNDETPLPGFDQDAFVVASGANDRSIDDILAEFMAVRSATLALYTSFPADVITKAGIASEHRLSVQAIVYITAGHVEHHLASIRTNYLGLV